MGDLFTLSGIVFYVLGAFFFLWALRAGYKPTTKGGEDLCVVLAVFWPPLVVPLVIALIYAAIRRRD